MYQPVEHALPYLSLTITCTTWSWIWNCTNTCHLRRREWLNREDIHCNQDSEISNKSGHLNYAQKRALHDFPCEVLQLFSNVNMPSPAVCSSFCLENSCPEEFKILKIHRLQHTFPQAKISLTDINVCGKSGRNGDGEVVFYFGLAVERYIIPFCSLRSWTENANWICDCWKGGSNLLQWISTLKVI